MIKFEIFKLPGKKKLIDTERAIKTIVINVTESPIERQKKAKKILFRKREKSYTEVSSSCGARNRKDYLS